MAKEHKLQLPKANEAWIEWASLQKQKQKAAVAAEERQRLLPRVITFDEDTGAPQNKQDSKEANAGSDAQENVVIIHPMAGVGRGRRCAGLGRRGD